MKHATKAILPILKKLKGGRLAHLAMSFVIAAVLVVPIAAFAEPIPVGVAATPIRQVGSIDCQGQPGSGQFGVMKISRSGNTLEVDVELSGARANTSFTIELWEEDPACFPDNNGNTGTVISTDGSGNGHATVTLNLPHRSLGTSTLGDGQGTERLVMALDDSFSQGAGDSYAAGPISIDVTAENEPPVVHAGEDREGTTEIAYLEGSASDDGKVQPLTYQWSKVSGPGAVSFDNSTDRNTTAQFTKIGEYILRLEAFDGEYRASDDVKVKVSDNYRVEFKSWIPQQQMADPFVLAPTRIPNAAIQYMGSPLKECIQEEANGLEGGYVDVISSKFLGDNHTDYGEFWSRGGLDARIGARVQVNWDGSNLTVNPTNKLSGLTQRVLTIRAADGSAKDCHHHGYASTNDVPDVVKTGPNKFKLVVKGYDPLTPRSAGQMLEVIDDLCENEDVVCIPGLSALLRLAPITPSLDGEVEATVQSDGTLKFDYKTDLFPSYGIAYQRNGGAVQKAVLVDASCIPTMGYTGAANLMIGLQTLALPLPGARNEGSLSAPYATPACHQIPHNLAVRGTEALLRLTVNRTTEPFLITATSRMPQ